MNSRMVLEIVTIDVQRFMYPGHSCPRYWPITLALSNGCQGTITFASTAFRGRATDLKVHPAFTTLEIVVAENRLGNDATGI